MTLQQSLKEVFNKALGTDITSEDLTQEVMSVFMQTLDRSMNFKSESQRTDIFIKMFTEDIEKPIFDNLSIEDDDDNIVKYDIGEFMGYVFESYEPMKIDDVWMYRPKVKKDNVAYTLGFLHEKFIKKLNNEKRKTN